MADFQRVGSSGDFQEGLVRVFDIGGVDVAVVKHEGRFYGFSGRCPHADYKFDFTRVRNGNRILCSSHFAWFQLETGELLSGPTEMNLELYEVRVEGEDVSVSNVPVPG